MKIAILDLDDIKNPLLGAGGAITTYELGKCLIALGHTVDVYCSKYPGFEDRQDSGIGYHHVGVSTNKIQLNNLFYILSIPLITPQIRADVIIECFTAPMSTLLSPLWTKIPVVVRPDSFDAVRFSHKYHLPFSLIEKYGARLYRYLLAFSDYTANKMKQLNPLVKTKIVPEGVNPRFFQIKREKAQHLLFIGRFDIGQKGIDLLLEAYASIKDQTKYPLIMAGYGPDEVKITQLISKYGLDHKVKLIGPTFGLEKSKYLSQAACVVLPSRNETFSCFSLEAMAAGCPLVTFDIPGLNWIRTPARTKVSAFQTKAFGEAIINTINPVKNQKMSVAARQYAHLFTWEQMAKKYESFINNEVLNKYKLL